MKYLHVKNALVTLGSKSNEPYLHIQDKELFPEGFRARISNIRNRTAIQDAIDAKYPDGNALPDIGVPAPRGDATSIPLGVDSHGAIASVPRDSLLPFFPVFGYTGAGKTVLLQAIADWASKENIRTHVISARSQEYAGLVAKHAHKGNLTVHDNLSAFLCAKTEEWQNATPEFHEHEVWIIDDVYSANDAPYLLRTKVSQDMTRLIEMSARARMWKTTIFMSAQREEELPTRLVQQGNYSVRFQHALGCGGAQLFHNGTALSAFRVGVPTLF